MPIVPPDWLSAAAREEWERIVPEMVKLGIISGLDTIVVAQYCETVADWIDARRQLNEHQRTVKYTSGEGAAKKEHVQVSAWYSIAKQLGQEVKKLAAELGLTPASRPSVKGKEAEAKGAALNSWSERARNAKGSTRKKVAKKK